MKKAMGMNKLESGKKGKKMPKDGQKRATVGTAPNHKKAFEQLLDDAVLGVEKKK
jgi:hypothetical protein